jgi:hypothetical protein
VDIQEPYIARYDASLSSLQQSSLAGGSQVDGFSALAADPSGNIYAAGWTHSPDLYLALPVQSQFAATRDVFLMRFPSGSSSPDFASYLGGSQMESAASLAVSPAGDLLVVGTSMSPDFPVRNPLQTPSGSTSRLFATLLQFGGSTGASVHAGTVTPASGAGGAQSFKFSVSHAGGAGMITEAVLAVSSGVTLAGACAVRHTPGASSLQLSDQAGNFIHSVQLGSNQTADNGRCMLMAPGSSITSSGTTVTVTAVLVFRPSMGGSMKLLVRGAAGGVSTGLVEKGIWTVPSSNSAPSATAVVPPGTEGPGGVFETITGDALGADDVRFVSIIVNNTYSFAAGCAVIFDRTSRLMHLADDSGSAWTARRIGEPGTLENSQCRLDAGASSESLSGLALTVRYRLEFKPSFNGDKTVYTMNQDAGGLAVGFLQAALFEVAASTQPVAVPSAGTASPASGSGAYRAFQFSVSSTGGASTLTEAVLLINATGSIANGCAVRFQPGSTDLELANSSGAFTLPVRLGTSDTADNGKCLLLAHGSSAASAGTTATVTVNLLLYSSFSGAKNIYVRGTVSSGLTTGFQARGTWTVPAGNSPPVPPIAYVPASPGTGGVFEFLSPDAQGADDVRFFSVVIGRTNEGVNGCYLILDRTGRSLYLGDDSLSAWTSRTIGLPGTAENSQCRVDFGGISESSSGGVLRLRIPVTLKSTLNGPVGLHTNAQDASGVQCGVTSAGSYQVNVTQGSPGTPPVPGAVTPSSGTGGARIFQFSASHPQGASHIRELALAVSSSSGVAGACVVRYTAGLGALQLSDTFGNYPYSVRLGTSDVANNGICTLMAPGSAVETGATAIKVTANLVLLPALAGLRNLLVSASSADALSSGWAVKGTWYVPSGASMPSVPAVVLPASPGSGGAFEFVSGDAQGAADIRFLSSVINTNYSALRGCFLILDRGANLLHLGEDSIGGWTNRLLGSAGTMENNQCRVDMSATSVTTTATTVKLKVHITFKPGFTGQKFLFNQVQDAALFTTAAENMGTYFIQ